MATKDTPHIVLIRAIREECDLALECFGEIDRNKGKKAVQANDQYALSVRQISILVHAMEKLNSI